MKKMTERESWGTVGRRWLKFNGVGAVGVGVQLTMLVLLAGALGLNYLIATGLAVETAVLHNFMWHERWTWVDRTRLSPRSLFARLLRFNLTTGAVSIAGNLVFMRLLVGALGFHYVYANVLTIASCSILNFLASDRLVFQPSPLQIVTAEPRAGAEQTR